MAADPMGFAFLGARPVRVAVAADQPLVAESVRAALLHRGYDPIVIHWPVVGDAPAGSAPLRLRSSRWSPGPPPHVGVLLSDLARINEVQGAQMLVSGIDVPWLVLAGTPHGPAWGALYECGAAVVVLTDTGLDAVCDLLRRAVPRAPVTGAGHTSRAHPLLVRASPSTAASSAPGWRASPGARRRCCSSSTKAWECAPSPSTAE